MIETLKFIFFIITTLSFGFTTLSQILKIRSVIFLIPFSISFGFAGFLFICHVLSFLIGPQKASILSLFILLISSLLILIIKHKSILKIEFDINKNQIFSILAIGITISILSFLAISRYGPLDKEFHTACALTIYHNNVYPPRDFYRPDYVLLYHYGGDLLAGAIYQICNIEISRSFEIMVSILSGTTFLSLVTLCWQLTKNFKVSLLGGFCSYFGGGLLWLDAIFRYLFKTPPVTNEWGFLETFLNLGIHGGIINAPSVTTFVSTFSLGCPLLIFSLIIFWKMLEKNNLKDCFFYIIFLNVSLLVLFISAEWLYTTFIAGSIPFLIILLFKKQKHVLIPSIILLLISTVINKSVGNALFLQEPFQHLGRANIFNLGIKEKLFHIMSWGRLQETLMNYQEISFFSWEFFSEFGLSLILFPLAIIYSIKNKNLFALLLFLCAATTMPLPLVIDFKLNPVDFNRLFAFGNTMIILLITCGISYLWKTFLKKKILIVTYLLLFCISPLSELTSNVILTPYIYSKGFVNRVLDGFKYIKSINDIKLYIIEFNNAVNEIKNKNLVIYKNELNFLKLKSQPKDVAISTIAELPLEAGLYSITPSKKWLYKDLIYSSFDNIYPTILTTLDPYLLNELNIKWILIDNSYKKRLNKEQLETLNTNLSKNEIFMLAYLSPKINNLESEQGFEIYHVEDITSNLKNYKRKTGWMLINKHGDPVEVERFHQNSISLFSTSKEALLYLKSLQNINVELKNELIIAQPFSIDYLENLFKKNNLNIILNLKFNEI